MRKGDEKRQEMLNVAERLFCVKGYEATSVQDILNVLHVSKGGFYHHFASKEAVLDTLFFQRAGRALEWTEASLAFEKDVVKRLNKLIYGFLPLRKEESDFYAMLLPMLDKPEGRALRLCYQEALHDTFLPAMQRELALGQEDGILCPAHGDVADIVLHMLNQCWVEVSCIMIESSKKAQRADAAALLSVLNKYRRTLERLLDAPFGSIEIITLQEWDDLTSRVMGKLLLPLQG